MTKPKEPNSKARLRKAFLSFYPERDQANRLKALSVATDRPQQVYLREGLDYILTKYKKEIAR